MLQGWGLAELPLMRPFDWQKFTDTDPTLGSTSSLSAFLFYRVQQNVKQI
jgi:hypothetical protein